MNGPHEHCYQPFPSKLVNVFPLQFSVLCFQLLREASTIEAAVFFAEEKKEKTTTKKKQHTHQKHPTTKKQNSNLPCILLENYYSI